MAKQEEVRMALVHWLAHYDSLVEKGITLSVSETIDEIINALHSRGVVIKVDRELPEEYAVSDFGGGLGMDSIPLFDKDGIKEAGYGAFELLVKDV